MKATSGQFHFRYIANMDHLMLAAETLQKAETDLRGIVGKAAASGDYAGVLQIASWAKAIRDLLEKKSNTRDNSSDRVSTGSLTAVVQAKNSRTPRKKQADDYPRFFRKGDELVRIAWSRRARSEYQHKTSESVLKKLAETLFNAGKEGRVFSTDDVLPIQDDNGSTIPAYQAYVCIALLKQTGLIDQHGRQGYSIACDKDFVESVESIWQKLPNK